MEKDRKEQRYKEMLEECLGNIWKHEAEMNRYRELVNQEHQKKMIVMKEIDRIFQSMEQEDADFKKGIVREGCGTKQTVKFIVRGEIIEISRLPDRDLVQDRIRIDVDSNGKLLE